MVKFLKNASRWVNDNILNGFKYETPPLIKEELTQYCLEIIALSSQSLAFLIREGPTHCSAKRKMEILSVKKGLVN